jgi:hypothetical protein
MMTIVTRKQTKKATGGYTFHLRPSDKAIAMTPAAIEAGNAVTCGSADFMVNLRVWRANATYSTSYLAEGSLFYRI